MEHTLGGHYLGTTLLKSGQGVTTLLGTDLLDGEAVVIKKTAAAAVPASAQVRLEHDAHVLERLASPRLAKVAVVRDGAELCLVAPFVPGPTLAERLRDGALSIDEALAVARGLLRALAEAHANGVLHRDVKPANVVLGDGSAARPVTLIDFGLARGAIDVGLDAAREAPRETAIYASPEQAGLIAADVGERSDLYSAGVVLFECLAGRPPFLGRTVGEILREQLSAPAPELRSLGVPVPRALDAVVQRLLRKDPRDRYQSAEGALADVDAIADALGRGVADPAIAIGARDVRATLTEPSFVGRETELAAFEAELALAIGGRSRLVVVEGESGVGKTRLLGELTVRAAQRGAWVLRGQASDAGAQRPLELLAGLVPSIVARARSEPAFARALRGALGERVDAVCEALPRLGPVLGPAPMPAIEDAGTARAGHGEALVPALAALLSALGTAERPAAIVLDDAQWADDLAVAVLARWRASRARAEEGDRGHVVLVVAYREEEVADDHPLRRIAIDRRIALPKLGRDHIRAIAVSMAGALPPLAIELVQRLSEGNAFFATAALEGLVEGGALVATPRGFEIEPSALASARSSRRGAAVLAERIVRLPERVLALLSVGAVLGRSFDVALAAEFAGVAPEEALADVEEARGRHFVFVDATGARPTFAHDRVRAALLARMPSERRRRVHKLAAERLAALAAGEVRGSLAFDVAYHFDAAGDATSALPFALEAAESARARAALEVAEAQYRIAERGLDGASTSLRRRVLEGLGDVLALRGRYDEARDALETAAALASATLERAQIAGKLGDLAFRRGRPEDAGAAIERALAVLGRGTPARLFLFGALVQALVQALHTIVPARWLARRDPRRRERDLLAARLYSRLAYAYWFTRGQAATFWAHLHELNVAEHYPGTAELAQACSEHAIGMTGVPRAYFYRRGLRFARRGLEIRRALGDRLGEGKALNAYGMLLYADAHHAEALHRFREAQRLLRLTGDRWEENIAGHQIGLCLYRLGSFRDAVEECRLVQRVAREIGDAHGTAYVLETTAKSTGGAIDEAEVRAALGSSGADAQTGESVLQAEGLRLLREGRAAEAAAAFTEGERRVRAAHIENVYVANVTLWRGHALRLAATLAESALVAPSRRLPEAERAIRRALRASRRYPGDRPMALREKALLLARRGAFRRAFRALDESLARASAMSSRAEFAATLYARGELRMRVGRPGGSEDLVEARAMLDALGAEFLVRSATGAARSTREPKVTLSLADRFEAIVDVGRRIVSAHVPDEVFEAARAAAETLLRGERSEIVLVDGDELRPHDEGRPSFSRTLVRRAIELGGAIVRPASSPDDVDDTTVQLRLRSAICVPIAVRGRAVACICVQHQLVGALFGDDERRLADYIATLAGAALERAEAFAEIQAFSRSLEERVAERTVALRAAQEQLVQAGKLAAIGTLVAGLSHEINNPIAVVLGHAQTQLRKIPKDDPVRRPMEAIERQALRCAALVRTLLDFARPSAAERTATKVEAMLAHVLELARPKARGADVRLDGPHVAEGTPEVHVCASDVESAVLDLVSNALDATARGGVVEVRASPSDERGRVGVAIEVEDRGTGISPDVLPRIFDPFFTTKPEGKGAGLGLSLARQIVEAHGGTVRVRTRVGEGTTMRVWLPADLPEAGARAVVANAGGAS